MRDACSFLYSLALELWFFFTSELAMASLPRLGRLRCCRMVVYVWQ